MCELTFQEKTKILSQIFERTDIVSEDIQEKIVIMTASYIIGFESANANTKKEKKEVSERCKLSKNTQ